MGDNFTMDLQELDWIGLAQNRDRLPTLVSAVMIHRVPRNEWKFLTSCKQVKFSGKNLYHGVSKNRYTRPAKNAM
jgi:hypothetical protein